MSKLSGPLPFVRLHVPVNVLSVVLYKIKIILNSFLDCLTFRFVCVCVCVCVFMLFFLTCTFRVDITINNLSALF